MRLVLSFLVLLALAVHRPSFAKETHVQHGARATTAGARGAGAKGAGANDAGVKATGVKATNSARTKTNDAIDTQAFVAPLVLPPNIATPQRNPGLSAGVKIVTPVSGVHGHSPATIPQAPRNAIGQPITLPKNLTEPALHAHGAIPPPVIHSSAATLPAASPNLARGNAAMANAAMLSSRGGINGGSVVRSSSAPSVIGGPAHPTYGISGATVQKKH